MHGAWHQRAEVKPVQQVVGRLLGQGDAEPVADDSPDVRAAEGGGCGPGLDPGPQSVVPGGR